MCLYLQRDTGFSVERLQLGVELAHAGSKSILVELVRVEDLSSFEHEVNRAGELAGHNRLGTYWFYCGR